MYYAFDGINVRIGQIYVVGGFNGATCLDSMEVYNPSTNQWTEIASMEEKRSGISIVAHQGYIFAIGEQ